MTQVKINIKRYATSLNDYCCCNDCPQLIYTTHKHFKLGICVTEEPHLEIKCKIFDKELAYKIIIKKKLDTEIRVCDLCKNVEI